MERQTLEKPSGYKPNLHNMVDDAGSPTISNDVTFEATRASIKEKAIGFAVVLFIATLSIKAIHRSMKGMGVILHVVPNGLAALAYHHFSIRQRAERPLL